mgnify:CR=1 FL=1|jgi:hypothetical protein
MKCSIMQPTFFPWSGYFNLIQDVDVFVFLDDVQFDRRSWQTRNRLIQNNKMFYINVPIEKQHRNSILKDIKIHKDTDWNKKCISQISNVYGKYPFFNDLGCIIDFLNNNFINLVDLNIGVIRLISEMLSIETLFVRASDLNCQGNRSDHLANICRKINATQYLSPVGSKEYLRKDGFLETHDDIELLFQNYVPGEYEQYKNKFFTRSLSIVDVIASIGISKTKEYIL